MPLIKIGRAYYNGEERTIFLLQGTATRDAEYAPLNGKPHTKVSVAAVSNSDESTTYVTVNGWRDRADQVGAVQKGDSILAVGALKKREYNGRDYYDLDADFVAVSGAGLSDRSRRAEAYASPRPQSAAGGSGFADMDDVDDGDLPF